MAAGADGAILLRRDLCWDMWETLKDSTTQVTMNMAVTNARKNRMMRHWLQGCGNGGGSAAVGAPPGMVAKSAMIMESGTLGQETKNKECQ